MNDMEWESELLKKGFNENNIRHLHKILNRNGGRETLPALLVDLRKRFYAGCFLLFIVCIPFLLKVLFNISGGYVSHIIFLVFCLCCIYQIVPMVLAWKAYRFLSKRG